MVELNKQAEKAMKNVDLFSNETVEHVFQADGFFLGTNPLEKLIGQLTAFLTKITGGHIRVFLILTNMRVIMIQSTAVWCGFNSAKGTNVIPLSGIREVGTAKETKVCCFHSRLIHIESATQRNTLVVKKFKDQQLKDFLNTVSILLINNSSSS